MADKIALNSVGSIIDATTAAGTINVNNAALVAAFNNTLSRDGTQPNTMGASIDMNSHSILNLPTPTSQFEPLRVIDGATIIGGGTITVNPLPTGGIAGQVLTKNSATNFDASWLGATTIVQPIYSGGRLTLTVSTPVTTTDVVGATTIWYAPMTNTYVSIYNGSALSPTLFTSSSTDTIGLPLVLGSNWGSGLNYDGFIVNDSGTVRFGTGPSWTTDTARGTGIGTTELQMFNGIWTNKNSITIRYSNTSTVNIAANQATYVGSFRTTSAGTTEDSAAKRYVWNCYNQTLRPLSNPTETTDNWNYTTAAFRQANGNTANQLDVLLGLPGNLIEAEAFGIASSSVGNIFTATGIGVDSTTVNSAQIMGPSTALTAGDRRLMMAKYIGYPSIGRHIYTWLEYSTASGTTQWNGDNANALLTQAGILGYMQN